MFELLDTQKALTGNQKKLIVAGAFGIILEFLDYFLIGFVLTFVAKPWNLTMGKSSAILLSSGLGAIFGAFFFGWLADRIGRRKVFISTIIVFTLGTAALITTPESVEIGWIYITAMRFIVGFGAGGLYCVDLPLVQEFMPSRLRGSVSGLITSMVPAGFLLGSGMVAVLSPYIGWRGLMGVCVGLSFVALIIRRWIPESPRWLVLNGRAEEAKKSMAWAMEVDAATLPDIPADLVEAARKPQPKLFDLLRYPKSLAVSWITNLGAQTGYYGLALWSPTLIVVTLSVSPERAAFYMVFVTCAAFVGRITVSLLSEAIGRRPTGILTCTTVTVALIVISVFGSSLFSSTVMFLIFMCMIYFFGEGCFAIVGPYSAEVWPSALRTTGMGSAYGFGGLGKILGPLGLALIAGSGTATTSGVQPQSAFLYFSAWYALAGLAFIFLGIETRGRSIEAIDAELERQSEVPSQKLV